MIRIVSLVIGKHWQLILRWPLYGWRPQHFLWTGGRTTAIGPLVLLHYLDRPAAGEAGEP